MRELCIGKNDAGQRLDRLLPKVYPAMPASMMSKGIRTKRIKVNGKRAEGGTRLAEHDVVSLYINDEYLLPAGDDMLFRAVPPDVQVIYEDDNVLLCDKPAGLPVHEDDASGADTLINRIKAYLFIGGKWNPDAEQSFVPALCNRIDRNTGGIVIAAKNAEALRIMNEKVKNRELEKLYLCLVHGNPSPESGRLTSYLKKLTDENRVVSSPIPMPDAKSAITEYRVIDSRGGLSLVECRLVTGRTHQIRVQMADIGHPLFGDGKYGRRNNDATYPIRMNGQALYSYKLTFTFKTDAGILEYLNGKSFSVKRVDFSERFADGSFFGGSVT